METLDKNELEKYLTSPINPVHCNSLPNCPSELYHPIKNCFPWLWVKLNTVLTACGEGFYVKCPEFDQLAKVCDFEPAFEAAKWKEKVHLDRLTQLESQVKELQISLKKKG